MSKKHPFTVSASIPSSGFLPWVTTLTFLSDSEWPKNCPIKQTPSSPSCFWLGCFITGIGTLTETKPKPVSQTLFLPDPYASLHWLGNWHSLWSILLCLICQGNTRDSEWRHSILPLTLGESGQNRMWACCHRYGSFFFPQEDSLLEWMRLKGSIWLFRLHGETHLCKSVFCFVELFEYREDPDS